MQATATTVEGNTQLDVGQTRKLFNRAEVCGSDIGSGEQPDRNVTIGERMKGVLETLPAAPLHEANNHQHSVGGRHLAFKFKAETGLVERVHQQAYSAERSGRGHGSDGAAIDGAQNLAS